MSDRSIWLIWLGSRVLVLGCLFGPESRVVSDVVYFSRSIRDMHAVGLELTMPEYPLPAVGAMALLWLIASLMGSTMLFGPLMVLCCVLLDALYTAVLSRTTGSGRRAALTLWLAAVPALGGLTYARFDLIPAMLVGLVVLLAGTHPRRAALCVAVATSVKLWPALLIPTAFLRTASRWRYSSVVAVIGVAAAGSTIALAGWTRLFSPLTYQADRGLQVESVAATPVMMARVVYPAGWKIFFSDFKANEITGAAVPLLERAADIATLVLALGLGLMWWRAWRRTTRLTPETLIWMSLMAVSGFMAAGKVLSPQYFLWLMPAAAAALAITSRQDQALRRWGLLVVVASALTHALYPWLARDLLQGGEISLLAVALLLLRNAILIWLFADSCRQTLRSLAATDSRLTRFQPGAVALDGAE